MTIQVLIAEDEPILAATLDLALKRLWPESEVVATCPHGVDAVSKALALRPDVLFLDIKMPGKTGLEVAEELAEQWGAGKPFPQIVFVTAYDEYAVEAFEREAADYVLKPISDARLGRTIERLNARLAAQSPNGGLDALLGQMRALLPAAVTVAAAATAPAERLTVIRAAVGNHVRMIPVSEVVYFEALDKYVNVVTQDSEALIRMSLKELLPQLDEQVFWQVHRGTIVNAACVLTAMQCALCHGTNGDTVSGVDLRRGQFRRAVSDEDIARVIATGVPAAGMPSFRFQPNEVDGLVAFIRAGFDVSGTAVKVGHADRGQAVFDGKGQCTTCHRVNGKGPRLAPDLSDIGAIRTPAALQRSLLDPTSAMLPINRPVRAVTRDGRIIRGRRLNEDTYTVQLIDDQDRLVSLLKADLRELTLATTSPMPSVAHTLTADEQADLLAYLLSLKGL